MTAICSDWLVGSFASAALVPSSQRHLREERGLGMAQFQSGHSRVAVLAEADVADRRLGAPKAGIFRAGTLPMRQRLILSGKREDEAWPGVLSALLDQPVCGHSVSNG